MQIIMINTDKEISENLLDQRHQRSIKKTI